MQTVTSMLTNIKTLSLHVCFFQQISGSDSGSASDGGSTQ